MNASPIKFGTDGWRAVMGKEFTFENVERVAQAYADFLNQDEAPKKKIAHLRVAVGFDFRKDSENFAKRVAEILAANHIEAHLAQSACPTPAISSAIVHDHYSSGIVVTASHNPPDYNGIKIKNDFGGSAEKSITENIERRIGKSPLLKEGAPTGFLKTVNFNKPYLERLERYLNLDLIKSAPYKILVDSMYGVGNGHIENLCRGGKVQIESIRKTRDVTFGGRSPEPIPKNLSEAIHLMKSGGFDLAVVISASRNPFEDKGI